MTSETAPATDWPFSRSGSPAGVSPCEWTSSSSSSASSGWFPGWPGGLGGPLSVPMRHEVRSSGLTARLSNYIRQSQAERERITRNPRYHGLGVLPKVHLRTPSLPRLSARNTSRLLTTGSTSVRVASSAVTSPTFSPFRNSGVAVSGLSGSSFDSESSHPNVPDRDVLHARSGLMSTLRAMSQSAGRKRGRLASTAEPNNRPNNRLSRFELDRERGQHQRSTDRLDRPEGAHERVHEEDEEEDEDEDDDDEDDDDEEEEEEEEEEDGDEEDRAEDQDIEDESVSKRARRDSSSSVGSSLSMEMPPLFSNGVIGQTTSHLVNRETDLSLNSLLSRSQALYQVNNVSTGVVTTSALGTAKNTPTTKPLAFLSASKDSSAAAVLASQSSSSPAMASKVYRSKVNEINSSFSSSVRAIKRPRRKWSSESDDGDDGKDDEEFLREAKRRHIIIAPDNAKAGIRNRKMIDQDSNLRNLSKPEELGLTFSLPKITQIVSSNLLATPGNLGSKPMISSLEAYEADQKRGVARAKNLLSAFEDEDHADGTQTTIVASVSNSNVQISSGETLESTALLSSSRVTDALKNDNDGKKRPLPETSIPFEAVLPSSTSLPTNVLQTDNSTSSTQGMKRDSDQDNLVKGPICAPLKVDSPQSSSKDAPSDSKSGGNAFSMPSNANVGPNRSTTFISKPLPSPSPIVTTSAPNTLALTTQGVQGGSSTNVEGPSGAAKVSHDKINLTDKETSQTGATTTAGALPTKGNLFTFGDTFSKNAESGINLFGSTSASNVSVSEQPMKGTTSVSFGLSTTTSNSKVVPSPQTPNTLPSLFQIGPPLTSMSDPLKTSLISSASSKPSAISSTSFTFGGASAFGPQASMSLPPAISMKGKEISISSVPSSSVCAPFQFGTQICQPSLSVAPTSSATNMKSTFSFGGSKIGQKVSTPTVSTASTSIFTFGGSTSIKSAEPKKLGDFASQSEVSNQVKKGPSFGDGLGGSKFSFGTGSTQISTNEQSSTVFGKQNFVGDQSVFEFGKPSPSNVKSSITSGNEFSFGTSNNSAKSPNDFSKPSTSFLFGSASNNSSTTDQSSGTSSGIFQFGTATKRPSVGVAETNHTEGASNIFQFGSSGGIPVTKTSSLPTSNMPFESNEQNKPANNAFSFGLSSNKSSFGNTFPTKPHGNDSSRSSTFNFGSSGISSGDGGLMKFSPPTGTVTPSSISLTSSSTMKPLGTPPTFGSPKSVNFSFGSNVPQNPSGPSNLTNVQGGGGLFQFGQNNSSNSSGIGGGFNFGGAPRVNLTGPPGPVNPTFGAPSTSFPGGQNPPSFGASSFPGVGVGAGASGMSSGQSFGSPGISGNSNQMFSIGTGQSLNAPGGRQIARARRRRK